MIKKGTNQLVSGVCSGIAERFDVDPFWIRVCAVGFLFLSFFTAAIVYIILSFIMPDKDEIQ